MHFINLLKLPPSAGGAHPPPALTPYGRRLCRPYIVTKTCLSENEGLVTPLVFRLAKGGGSIFLVVRQRTPMARLRREIFEFNYIHEYDVITIGHERALEQGYYTCMLWLPAPCPEMHGHGASFCPYTIILFRFTRFLNVLLSMGIKIHRALATKQGLKSTMHRFSHEQ